MRTKVLPSASLESKQPIYKVEKDCLISKNADVTVAFQLELPEIFTLSRDDYALLQSALVKAVRLLPDHCVVHKQDWFVEDKYAPGCEGERTLLSAAYERHFHERPFLNHCCYLLITKCSSERPTWRSTSGLLARRHIVPRDMLDPKVLESFFDSVGQFVRTLEGAGPANAPFIRARRLTSDELAGTAEKAGLLEKYLSLDFSDQARQVDLDLTSGLKVGAEYCQLFSVANLDDLPPSVETDVRYEPYSTEHSDFPISFAAPLGLLLGCNHILNQYLFLDNTQKTVRTFEQKKDRLRSLSLYSRQNALNYEYYNAYLQELLAQQRRPVRVHCNVLTWSPREDALGEVRKLVSAAFNAMNCKPRQNTVDIAALYWGGIPGNAGDFPAEETFYTFIEQAVCFWACETNYRSTAATKGIKLSDRLTGRPVLVDLSDEPMKRQVIFNRNKFVLGPSGSGKSFFTNHMVRQYYEQGAHVLLVDTGNSYQGLCELVGGVYFTYEEDKPIAFNPFLISGQLDVEKKESIKTLLQALWKKDEETVSQSEYVSLSTAVSLYYVMLEANPHIRPSFNTFYEFVRSSYRRVLEEERVREKDFDLDNFLYVLSPYYRGGEYDYLLNSERELDLVQAPFIVFELDNIKDHPILFPVVTLIIMETFISKMRKLQGVRKMILIEEAWKALTTAGMAAYIKYLFKTVRKFFGEAIVVTQEIDDLIGNEIVKDAILNNSDCKILLDQRKFQGRFDEIQALLSLTPKEKDLVLSINRDNKAARGRYTEVFISLGGVVSKVYALEVSKEEYVTYTTEETEKVRRLEKFRQTGDMATAIKLFAAELRES
ncbi:TraG family conjugative transposon ATPase [Hymenobacter seoulensis]